MRVLAILFFLMITTNYSLSQFAPSHAWGVTFENVIIHSVENGNSFIAELPVIYVFIKNKLNVRIRGIVIPNIEGNCEKERDMAHLALAYLHDLLFEAERIVLVGVERLKYYLIIATVKADGVDVGARLLDLGLARSYRPEESQGWCS